MMEYIFEATTDMDGIECYIKRGEVVRCKDCKHKVVTEDGEYDPEDIVCEYWMSDGLNSNDYCSYGERKE